MDVEHIFREESGRILATLIGLLGSFDLAEEAMQEAFAVALEKWPVDGTPANPRAWLISTARFRWIDSRRRDARFDAAADQVAEAVHPARENSRDGSLDDQDLAGDTGVLQVGD